MKSQDASDFARFLLTLPPELAAYLLAARLTTSETSEREVAHNAWSVYAFPGPVPGIDFDLATRVLARCLVHLNIESCSRFLNQSLGDRGEEVFAELCAYDTLAATCYVQQTSDNTYLDTILQEYLETVDVERNWARAVELKNRGELVEAFSCLAAAVTKNPRHSGIRNNLANIYSVCGLSDQARSEYRASVEIDPTNGDAWYSLGCL